MNRALSGRLARLEGNTSQDPAMLHLVEVPADRADDPTAVDEALAGTVIGLRDVVILTGVCRSLDPTPHVVGSFPLRA